MSTKSAKLICTYGISDLQLLVKQGDQALRITPADDNIRALHHWLLEQTNIPGIIDIDDVAIKEHKRVWDPKTATFILNDGAPATLQRDESGAILLASPKLLRALPTTLQKHSLALRSVLLLETHQDDNHQFAAKEPIATGYFIERYLRDQYGEHLTIERVRYLQGQETLGSQNAPLDPAIAKRLENILRTFIQDERPNTTVLIGTFGGIPAIKDVINQATLLFARKETISLFSNESGSGSSIQYPPSDTLRARRIAKNYIKRGGFLEAYAAVTEYHDREEDQGWVDPLRQASRLINGNPVDNIVSLPALAEILTLTQTTSCLLAAFRIESALFNQRWLEAINGTVTFCEAAFIDAIPQIRIIQSFDVRERRIRFNGAPPEQLFAHGSIAELFPNRGKPGSYKSDVVGYRPMQGWLTQFQQPVQAALQALHTRIYDNTADNEPNKYRNYNTHSILTQAEIDAAIETFTRAKLWSKGIGSTSLSPGTAFLDLGVIKNVITALTGCSQPGQLYQALLKQLILRLDDPQHCLTASSKPTAS